MLIQRLLFFTLKVAYQKTGKTPAKFLKTYILEISEKWKKITLFFSVIRSKDSNCLDLFSFYRFLFVYIRATSWHFLCLQMREGLAVDCYPDGWHADASWSSGKSSPPEFEFGNPCGFLGLLEDAWSTFPRRLLQVCLSVVPKCFVHRNGLGGLKHVCSSII